jgi:hypothetical protein
MSSPFQTSFSQPIKFLGAYVVNVSLSMGWGAESGYCNLELVEEPKDGAIFNPPSIGTACLFQVGKLSFGGILKKYDYKVSAGEGRRYSVTIESPGTILNGVYLVLSKFQGTIYTDDSNIDNSTLKPIMIYGKSYPTNIINVYAHKENYRKGGKFGAADLNDLGYPVKNIISDINSTIKDGTFGGKIYYSESQYDLDLSDLQQVIDLIPGFRISGDFITINDFIGKITDMGLFDFTYTVTGTPDQYGVLGANSNATIKVKVLSRRVPPTPNAIKSIIDGYNAAQDKNVVSYSIGKEIPDVTTQQVLIGGQASRYWLANRKYILPIWGSLGTGQTATYFYGNSLYEYGNMFAPVRVTIDGGGEYGEGNYTYVDTNLLELRCALGSRDAWTAYHILLAIRDGVDGVTFGNFSITQNDFSKLLQGKLSPNDLIDTSISHAETMASYMYGMEPISDTYQDYAQRVVNARYNSIRKAAEKFYGREFLVAIPAEPGGVENNFRWVSFDQKAENSWDIADSAWAGNNSNSYFPDLSFYDNNGRMEAIAIYPNYNNMDFSDLGNDYGRSFAFGTNYGVVVKANVDTRWGIRWLDIATSSVDSNGNIQTDSAGNPIITKTTYGFVKVDVPAIPIYDEYTSTYNGFNVLCNLIFGTNILPGYHNMFGFENLDFEMPPSYVAPEYIGIPQESQRYVWGPWYSFNADGGHKGKVSIENNTEMRPELFGSTTLLNQAASTFVNAELTSVTESETGFLELAELPQYGLAERFFGSGPYVTSMSISISANGGYNTTYNFQNWTKKFAQFARYNIDQFIKGRSHVFQFQKQLRDLFRNPPAFPLGKLYAKSEPKLPKINPVANNMIVGNFINGLAYSINNPNDDDPELTMNSSSAPAAMRSFGMNYMESFGASMEQIYTPVFLYDQRKPEQVKRAFNEGNL